MPSVNSHHDKENLGRANVATKRSSIGSTANAARPLPRVATLASTDKDVRSNATISRSTISPTATPTTLKKPATSTGSTISNRPGTATKSSATKPSTSTTTSTVRSVPDASAKRSSTGSTIGTKHTAPAAPKMSAATLKRLSTQKSAPVNERGPRLAVHIKSPSTAGLKTSATPLTPTIKPKDSSTEYTTETSPSRASKRDSRYSRVDSGCSNPDSSPFSPELDISDTDSTHESVDMTVKKPQTTHANAASPTRPPARPTGPRVGQPPPISAANLATFHDARYLTPEEQRIVRAFREDPDHIVFKRLADEEDHTFGQVVEDMELHSVSQINELTKLADERLKQMDELRAQLDRMESKLLGQSPAERSQDTTSVTDSGTMTLEAATAVSAAGTREPSTELELDGIMSIQESAMALQKEIDSLQADINELHRREMIMHAEADRNKALIMKLQSEVKSKAALAESDQMTIIKLKHDLMSSSQDCARKSEVLDRYNQELIELQQANKELEKLPNGLDGLYKQIRDLGSKNLILSDQLSDLTTTNKELTTTMGKLNAGETLLRGELDQLLLRNEQLREIENKLEEKSGKLVTKVAGLETANEELKTRCDSLVAHNEDLNAGVAELSASNENLQSRNLELGRQKNKADSEVALLTAKNQSLSIRCESLQATQEELRNEKDSIVIEKDQLQTKNNELQNLRRELESTAERLETDMKALQSRYDQVQAQNESSTEREEGNATELIKTQDQLKSLLAEKLSWEIESKKLEQEVEMLDQERQTVATRLQSVEKELHDVLEVQNGSSDELQLTKKQLSNAQAELEEFEAKEKSLWEMFESLGDRVKVENLFDWTDFAVKLNAMIDTLEEQKEILERQVNTATRNFERAQKNVDVLTEKSESAQRDMDKQLEDTKERFRLPQCESWPQIVQAISSESQKLQVQYRKIVNEGDAFQSRLEEWQESCDAHGCWTWDMLVLELTERIQKHCEHVKLIDENFDKAKAALHCEGCLTWYDLAAAVYRRFYLGRLSIADVVEALGDEESAPRHFGKYRHWLKASQFSEERVKLDPADFKNGEARANEIDAGATGADSWTAAGNKSSLTTEKYLATNDQGYDAVGEDQGTDETSLFCKPGASGETDELTSKQFKQGRTAKARGWIKNKTATQSASLDNIEGHQLILQVIRDICRRCSDLENKAQAAENRTCESCNSTPLINMDNSDVALADDTRNVGDLSEDEPTADAANWDPPTTKDGPMEISQADCSRVKYVIHKGTDRESGVEYIEDIGELKLNETTEDIRRGYEKSLLAMEEFRKDLQKRNEALAAARAQITRSFSSMNQELRSARELTRLDDQVSELSNRNSGLSQSRTSEDKSESDAALARTVDTVPT